MSVKKKGKLLVLTSTQQQTRVVMWESERVGKPVKLCVSWCIVSSERKINKEKWKIKFIKCSWENLFHENAIKRELRKRMENFHKTKCCQVLWDNWIIFSKVSTFLQQSGYGMYNICILYMYNTCIICMYNKGIYYTLCIICIIEN